MEDVTFFDELESGKITKLPWSVSDEEIMAAASATLKLDNQKNGWKGVCVCTTRQMVIHFFVQYERWAGDTAQLVGTRRIARR